MDEFIEGREVLEIVGVSSPDGYVHGLSHGEGRGTWEDDRRNGIHRADMRITMEPGPMGYFAAVRVDREEDGVTIYPCHQLESVRLAPGKGV